MRILLLQDADWTKKGPHQQHHLMELLSLKCHKILVIGFDQLWMEERNGIYSKRLKLTGIWRFYKGADISFIRPSFIRLQLIDYLSFSVSSMKDILYQIKGFHPDIIIGYSGVITNLWGLIGAKIFKIPYIYYCVDNPSAFSLPMPLMHIAEFIVKIILNRSDIVLTINEALNDYVISLGSDPIKTKVVPQGVDFKRFDISNEERNKVRRAYNISDQDILLFFMGWLYTFSGLREVISDIYKYKDLYPHIKLMIVGYGDDYSSLRKLIESLNLEDRIIMTGKKNYDEIPTLLSAADICLLPAHNDNVIRDIVPIKIYEYLAMHKPVISTKLPGMMRECGLNSGVIYVDSPEEVIKTISKLTKEDIALNGMKAQRFIKDFGWDDIISKFEYILFDLISEYADK